MTRNVDGSPKPDYAQKPQTYFSVFSRYFLMLVMMFGLGAIGLSLNGCKSSSAQATTASAEEDPKQAENLEEGQQEATDSPSDLNNLAIGQTATWDNYSITIDSVVLDNGNTLANVTMAAKKDSTFASRYLDGFTENDKQVDAQDTDDVNVKAGESYTAELSYPSEKITSLKWDNWFNEATWHFDTPKPAPQPQTDKSKLKEAIARFEEAGLTEGISFHYHWAKDLLEDPSATQESVDSEVESLEKETNDYINNQSPASYPNIPYEDLSTKTYQYVAQPIKVSGSVVNLVDKATFNIVMQNGEYAIIIYDPAVAAVQPNVGDTLTIYGLFMGFEYPDLPPGMSSHEALQIVCDGFELNGKMYNAQKLPRGLYLKGEYNDDGSYEGSMKGLDADGRDPSSNVGSNQISVDGQLVDVPGGLGYIVPGSDGRAITADDLSGLSNVELWLARNEVYARHGHSFKTPDLQNWFNQMSWYQESDSPTDISKLEEKNVDVIQAEEARRGSPYAK